jgi:hypothetical protein
VWEEGITHSLTQRERERERERRESVYFGAGGVGEKCVGDIQSDRERRQRINSSCPMTNFSGVKPKLSPSEQIRGGLCSLYYSHTNITHGV